MFAAVQRAPPLVLLKTPRVLLPTTPEFRVDGLDGSIAKD